MTGKTRAARRKSVAPGSTHRSGAREPGEKRGRRPDVAESASARPKYCILVAHGRPGPATCEEFRRRVIEPRPLGQESAARHSRQGAPHDPPATAIPFDDIRALVARCPARTRRRRDGPGARRDYQACRRARPPGESRWLAAWQGRAPPAVNRPLVAVFAGNHGVDGARRLGLSRGGDPADGRQFRRAAAPPSTRSAPPTTSASRSSTSPSICRPATSRRGRDG